MSGNKITSDESSRCSRSKTKILGFTARREEKIKEPLDHLGTSGRCVSVAHQNKFVRRYWSLIDDGRSTIRQYQPDILLVDGADLIGFLVILLGIRYQLPVVIRQGGDPWRVRKEKRKELRCSGQYGKYVVLLIFYLANKFTFFVADGFIVVSQELAKVFRANTNCRDDNIKVVYSPIVYPEVDSGENSSLTKPTDERYIILTVTNLRFRGKFEGVCDSIPDVADLLSQYHNAEYIIAGSGPYHSELTECIDQTITDESVRDRIHTPVFVNEVDELYDTAGVFLYISYIDAYPSVILEAQAAGLPIIANDAHGIPEQIVDGKTGLLIDPSTGGEIRRKLTYLLENQSVRRQLGVNGAERVRQTNSPEVVAERMYEAVREICTHV